MTELRQGKESDLNFIYDTWLASSRDTLVFEDVRNTFYFAGYRKQIDNLLKRSKVFVLTPKDAPDLVVSYCVVEEIAEIPVIHFAYTRFPYRKMGLVNQMLSEIFPQFLEEGAMVTCFPFLFKTLKEKNKLRAFLTRKKLILNPFLGDL